jgi:hypothetical protein
MVLRWPAWLACAGVLFPALANAQTWADRRTTPALRELVSVDRTGEPNWLFGAEDIAGDGVNRFEDAEQSADVRSAYVATDQRRLWARVYVSSQEAPEELAVFAFVDTDRNPATGGSASAAEVDPVLDTQPRAGGYEFVLEMRAAPATARIFRFNSVNAQFQEIVDREPLEIIAESGTHLDPLRLVAAENGYVQAALTLVPLGLAVTCDADFLFRSSGSMGIADLDVGVVGPCVPRDDNDNGLADVAETDAACTTDAQCPADGVCRDGQCEPPASVDEPGDAVSIEPGEVVQGGAFSCEIARSARPSAWLLVALALGAGLRRARRVATRRGPKR